MKIRHSLILLILLLGGLNVVQAQSDKQILIETKQTSLILKIGNDHRLYQQYLGPRLQSDAEKTNLQTNTHEAYIASGTDNLFEPAIRLVHNDGNPSLVLNYKSHKTQKINEDITLTSIVLKDPQYPVEVTLNFKTYRDEDVLEQWVEITHHEKKAITLFNYASSMLHFNADNYWLTQFHGDWAKEMRMQENQLTSGIKIIDSKLGTRAHMYQTPVFFLSFNGKADENNGRVIAGTIGWSGNFRFLFEIDEQNSLRVISGINPFASEYSLAPGIPFVTPSFIFTYSDQGKGIASRNLHKWARNYGILDGNSSRLTLLNNWEATGFGFNEQQLSGLLDDTKKLGADLFLLDDGWFGNKYPRNSDNAGLGDWQENKVKLPNGIGHLVREANYKGVKFGIWLEPEMVNPKSELYEKHPDWILKLPNRPEHYYRNQLVLDLTNPVVQNFVYNIVDEMLVKTPRIAFIKWDCNRMMTNAYSPYLKDKQSQLYVEYVRSLYAIFAKLRQKYPHLPIMLCSGGGGRVDYGALKYFTEFWPSDNTDAAERVYIQWGYSYFFPSIATCNHITSWGNESLKYRTDVAMMGKMGYDLRINDLNKSDLTFSQEALKTYHRISPIVWYGDLFRLISPYNESRAVLMYVNESKDKAILFSYTLYPRWGDSFNKVRLQGLDPNKSYHVKEINLYPGSTSSCPENEQVLTGDYLMKVGLWTSQGSPLSSTILELSE